VAATADGELCLGVLHDLDGLSDLIGTARTEDALRVHDLVVGPELLRLVFVDIVAAVEDGVGDILAQSVAATGAARALDRSRHSSSRQDERCEKRQHGGDVVGV
jgi:hypothetical protein